MSLDSEVLHLYDCVYEKRVIRDPILSYLKWDSCFLVIKLNKVQFVQEIRVVLFLLKVYLQIYKAWNRDLGLIAVSLRVFPKQ